MYCKDCKFYKKNGIQENKIIPGECINDKLRYADELESDDELAYYDAEDYYAGLIVGELFGCVHFKEKEDIQKLYATIEKDFKCLNSVLNRWKEISEDKWINKSKFNSHQYMFMKLECDQFVHDCLKLLEEIEINESKRVD